MAHLQENDILFACKALNLVSGLSANARRVAGAIIDHFNRKTGQCDPSVGRLARMLDVDRSTIMRATNDLCSEEHGLFEKTSHGGMSHRTSYVPRWDRFREIVEDWEARMKTGDGHAKVSEARGSKVAKLRRPRSQNCDVKGRKTATQTNLINQSNKPIGTESTGFPYVKQPTQCQSERPKGLGKGNKPPGGPSFLLPIAGGKSVSKGKAARAAAERRCSHDMAARGQSAHALYIEHMTPALLEAAAEREMRRHGAGLEFIDEMLGDLLLWAGRGTEAAAHGNR
ncbi:MAG: helix-turn-helix domain-containing protein [Hyphomicrobiales bacterium]|nr:helix-turn-helix domain-containing protein [Hyphomicrobiales bacterium]